MWLTVLGVPGDMLRRLDDQGRQGHQSHQGTGGHQGRAFMTAVQGRGGGDGREGMLGRAAVETGLTQLRVGAAPCRISAPKCASIFAQPALIRTIGGRSGAGSGAAPAGGSEAPHFTLPCVGTVVWPPNDEVCLLARYCCVCVVRCAGE